VTHFSFDKSYFETDVLISSTADWEC